MSYQIIEIPENSYHHIEQIGTKEKFWIYGSHESNQKKLFKIGRPGTGENWAEKVTCELAKLISLPCADYEFAIWRGKEGVLSPFFLPTNAILIHGNEILVRIEKNYPQNKSYKVREHKLSTVLAIIKSKICQLPIGYEDDDIIRRPLDLFMGYLMFDCWVSNPDRHHENWGFVFDVSNKTLHLAPTYDHASGLGCRVSDKERLDRLKTNDKRYNIDAFVSRIKSAFYDSNLQQLKTIDAFHFAAKYNSNAAQYWLNKLKNISQNEIENIFKKVPVHLISHEACKFALAILEANKKRLIESIGND
ncbi:MAG: phosphatidylinositol kinase [Smithella sp.]